MSVEVQVAGQWLSAIAPYGEVGWSHVADGGCKAASWKMDLPLTYAHPALSRGSLVRIAVGTSAVWRGILTEPDVDADWTFNAIGLAESSADYECLDGSGNTTSKPDTAIDRAIADGIGWTRPSSLSSSAFGAADTTDGLNRLTDLLDAWADSVGKRWGVNAAGQVYAATDPATPTWFLAPGTDRLGLADDNYASDLYVRYLSSSGYATAHVFDATARAQFGRREYGMDATSQGLLTPTQAAMIGNSALAKGKARLAFTNGVEVTRNQLTTPGGAPACLAFVKAGDLVRQLGVLNEQGAPVGYVDWLIGETTYQAGADTISLTPVGLADRNIEDIFTVSVA